MIYKLLTGKSGTLGTTDQGKSVIQEGVGATDVTADQSKHVGRVPEPCVRGGGCGQEKLVGGLGGWIGTPS